MPIFLRLYLPYFKTCFKLKNPIYKKAMAFIVFEGIDGSGKSSLLKLFTEKLQNYGIHFVQTKEPGGTEIGRQIRNLLLEKNNTKLNPLSETLLYYADRQQHIQELIAPLPIAQAQ